MYLLDTNIFLEILLSQEKANECKEFINANLEDIYISDFALHSIGVILIRYGKSDVLRSFISELLPNVETLALPVNLYDDLVEVCEDMNLDFDDAYQYLIAKQDELEIVTMDKDFRRVTDVNVVFI